MPNGANYPQIQLAANATTHQLAIAGGVVSLAVLGFGLWLARKTQ